jgi:hypothetical protein
VSYRLSKLASGSYDVLLNGIIIASLVRNGSTSNAPWTAELLIDIPQRRCQSLSPRQSHTSAARRGADLVGSPDSSLRNEGIGGTIACGDY